MSSQDSYEAPLIMLLHANPLDEDIPDVEPDLDKKYAFQALLNSRKKLRLKSLPLTKDSFVEGLRTARVLIIGAHGVHGKGVLFETAVASPGEFVVEADIEPLVRKVKGELPRMVFVAACHSAFFGKILVDLGVDHVIAIADDDRLSNFVARNFFKILLQSLLDGKTFAESFEEGIVHVETHPDLPLVRRQRQREKFRAMSRPGGIAVVFCEDELLEGDAEDLTEKPTMIGFHRTDVPRPLFGRQTFIRNVMQSLLIHKRLFLGKYQQNVGCSIIVHTICRHLSDRSLFEVIYLFESYSSAQRFLEGKKILTNSLIVVDPVPRVEEPTNESWCLHYCQKQDKHASFLLVLRSVNPGQAQVVFTVDPLEPEHISRMKSNLGEYLDLPQSSFASDAESSSPSGVIRWAKSTMIQMPTNIERLRAAKENGNWFDILDQIVQTCVVGPEYIWLRRQRRHLSSGEVEWIKQMYNKYRNIDEFWLKWLEPTLSCLSFVETFWTNKSVLGFISEDQINNVALRGKEPGTFLFRCSERAPGGLTLCHVTDSRKIEKIPAIVDPDGSVSMPSSAGVITYDDLYDAVQRLPKLKNVVISHDGAKCVDKLPAFSDIFSDDV